MVLLKHLAKAITLGGLTILVLPVPVPALIQRVEAQAFPARLRRPPAAPGEETYTPPNAPTQTTAAPAVPNAAPAAANVPPSQPAALPPSMLQQPALPATIQFSTQSLSIRADNSSLRDILHELAEKTGMDVQGIDADERVFGSFGPGDPEEVVGDLLNGTQYNVLMVGVLANGAPRQLVLSPMSHVAGSVVPSSPPPPADDDADDTPPPDNNDAPPPQRTRPLQNAPQPPQPGEPPSPQGIPTVKSPQELFLQLQQMHEQQQQQPGQQQQQQQQPPTQQQPPAPQQ